MRRPSPTPYPALLNGDVSFPEFPPYWRMFVDPSPKITVQCLILIQTSIGDKSSYRVQPALLLCLEIHACLSSLPIYQGILYPPPVFTVYTVYMYVYIFIIELHDFLFLLFLSLSFPVLLLLCMQFLLQSALNPGQGVGRASRGGYLNQ